MQLRSNFTYLLRAAYDIKEFRDICPRIRVSDFSENFFANDLAKYALQLNQAVSYWFLVWFLVGHAYEEQDIGLPGSIAYRRIMEFGYIIIGYDSSRVFYAITVLRCYTCNKYGHSSKCNNKPVAYMT